VFEGCVCAAAVILCLAIFVLTVVNQMVGFYRLLCWIFGRS